MTPRVLWLGCGPAPAAHLEVFERLPSAGDLRGALVVQPHPLADAEALHLQADVAARGARLALALGIELPTDALAARVFCFAAGGLPPGELVRQLDEVAGSTSIHPRRARFRFRTLALVEPVAQAIAALFPQPSRRVVGVIELLLNAHEHGNLGLTSSEKQALLLSGAWRTELELRESRAPWCERFVEAEVSVDDSGWTVTVRDEGSGFVPQPHEGPGALRGRGIELARQLSFDSLDFEGRGNVTRAWVRR